ncbi:MAG: PH domain-containing protein [Patescibacteria group bacterium]
MPDVFISQKKKEEIKVATSTLKGHTHNPLASYCPNPEDARFVGQDKEEKIVLLLRRHPITNVGWILIAILMIFAPIVLTKFPLITFLPDRFQLVAMILWYLVIIAFVYEQFLDWYFNVFIITDERVIDVDFINLIYREVTDANIDRIQDVTVQMGGVIRALFNYGNVIIQTAAEIPLIEFESVPKPDEVAKVLRELRVEEELEKIEGRVR